MKIRNGGGDKGEDPSSIVYNTQLRYVDSAMEFVQRVLPFNVI